MPEQEAWILQFTTGCFSAIFRTSVRFTFRPVPAVYAQYPQTATAYVAHNGVLFPAAQHAQPIIDYGGGYMAQLPGGAAYATDVAAAAGSGKMRFYEFLWRMRLCFSSKLPKYL